MSTVIVTAAPPEIMSTRPPLSVPASSVATVTATASAVTDVVSSAAVQASALSPAVEETKLVTPSTPTKSSKSRKPRTPSPKKAVKPSPPVMPVSAAEQTPKDATLEEEKATTTAAGHDQEQGKKKKRKKKEKEVDMEEERLLQLLRDLEVEKAVAMQSQGVAEDMDLGSGDDASGSLVLHIRRQGKKFVAQSSPEKPVSVEKDKLPSGHSVVRATSPTKGQLRPAVPYSSPGKPSMHFMAAVAASKTESSVPGSPTKAARAASSKLPSQKEVVRETLTGSEPGNQGDLSNKTTKTPSSKQAAAKVKSPASQQTTAKAAKDSNTSTGKSSETTTAKKRRVAPPDEPKKRRVAPPDEPAMLESVSSPPPPAKLQQPSEAPASVESTKTSEPVKKTPEPVEKASSKRSKKRTGVLEQPPLPPKSVNKPAPVAVTVSRKRGRGDVSDELAPPAKKSRQEKKEKNDKKTLEETVGKPTEEEKEETKEEEELYCVCRTPYDKRK